MTRETMKPIHNAVRAYFAPVSRDRAAADAFDPSVAFDLDAPPAPWIDLGAVENLRREPKSEIDAVRTGPGGLERTQYRRLIEAKVSLEFCEWGKLQMALAAGSQNLNVLESAGQQQRASGGTPKPAVPIASGSTSTEIFLDAGGASQFRVGELIVVDEDYVDGMQYLGSGLTGDVARSGVALDVNAVRRVSFNVARVSEVTESSLKLLQPLLGGDPVSTAKVQRVVAFVDREGASFFQDWSALFVLEEASGGRIYFYYPRLQTASAAAEGFAEIAPGIQRAKLSAQFVAMPTVDENDGETVLCYRTYVPAPFACAY